MTKTSYEELKKLGVWSGKCLVWTNGSNGKGYGQFKGKLVHRLAWFLVHGKIPKGKKICHTCDNPPCFWIGHLFCATQKQNVQDAIQKGRFHGWKNVKRHHRPSRERWKSIFSLRNYNGSKNPRAKLRWCDIDSIFNLWERDWTCEDIAEKYNVGRSTISNIVYGHTWRRVS